MYRLATVHSVTDRRTDSVMHIADDLLTVPSAKHEEWRPAANVCVCVSLCLSVCLCLCLLVSRCRRRLKTLSIVLVKLRAVQPMSTLYTLTAAFINLRRTPPPLWPPHRTTVGRLLFILLCLLTVMETAGTRWRGHPNPNPRHTGALLSPIHSFPAALISYHVIIVDLKRQNHLKVGTDKPKLEVKMQSVSDDDVRKRLLSWRWKVYSDWEDDRAFQVFGPATGKARLPTVDRLTVQTLRRFCVQKERVDC